MRRTPWLAALVLCLAPAAAPCADVKDKDDFVPLFNGRDLTGWVNVNCHPGTFYVKDGEVITTGKPTGFLRTAKQYENFVLEMEWLHVNKTEVGNSGLFVWGDPLPAVGSGYTRGIEVQVLVNLEKEGYYTSQGDLFSIWGAHCTPDRPHPQGWERCLPSEKRCKGGGEWNHYRVVANDGVIKLHVNGKEVSGVSKCSPRKGYLALESEGAECHFRNLKIKELPSTNPKPNEVADVAKDFVNLYTGLDLSGWQADASYKAHWRPQDWKLHYDGKGGAKDSSLLSAKEYGDFELVCDWRLAGKSADATVNLLSLRGGATVGRDAATKKAEKKAGDWNRFLVTVKGDRMTVKLNGATVAENQPLTGAQPKGYVGLVGGAEPVEFANLFVRELTK